MLKNLFIYVFYTATLTFAVFQYVSGYPTIHSFNTAVKSGPNGGSWLKFATPVGKTEMAATKGSQADYWSQQVEFPSILFPENSKSQNKPEIVFFIGVVNTKSSKDGKASVAFATPSGSLHSTSANGNDEILIVDQMQPGSRSVTRIPVLSVDKINNQILSELFNL